MESVCLVNRNRMQCNQHKNHVVVGQILFCMYNEILRQKDINSMKFYENRCDVNIDDEKIKQQFKFAYEVLRFIPSHSVKEQKHQAVYDGIKVKYTSTIRSHFPLISKDYDEFIDYTNEWLFDEYLNIEISFPEYDSKLKYRLDKFR